MVIQPSAIIMPSPILPLIVRLGLNRSMLALGPSGGADPPRRFKSWLSEAYCHVLGSAQRRWYSGETPAFKSSNPSSGAAMSNIFGITLENMERTLRVLEARVSRPIPTKTGQGTVLRYKGKSAPEAIIQKLARYISGLNAAQLLLNYGYIQELGAIQRMLDEFHEDISFLAFGIIFRDQDDLHKRYLEYFYLEEFDLDGKSIAYSQGRPLIPRKKIREYLAKHNPSGISDKELNDLQKALTQTYSGYVHGASPHIMDMCIGDPPSFRVKGLVGTIRIPEHFDDLKNYYYRGIISCAFAAKAFGDEVLFKEITDFRNHFEIEARMDIAKIPKSGR